MTRVGVVGGGNSAGSGGRLAGSGRASVTLLHRRADLRETMSDYLIAQLDRYGVAVRDRSEIARLHGRQRGSSRRSRSRTESVSRSAHCSFFLGAQPCTDWVGEAVARDERGFILTGEDAGAAGLLETSVPGIYAAGDVRSGSTKRCATAVGEGAAVVGYIHERLASVPG